MEIEHTTSEDCRCIQCHKRLKFYEIIIENIDVRADDLNWQTDVRINLKFLAKYQFQEIFRKSFTKMIVKDRANMETDIPDFVNHSSFWISIYQLLQFTKRVAKKSLVKPDSNNTELVNLMIASFMWKIIDGKSPWDN